MNHIWNEHTENWEENYLAKRELRNTLTSVIVSCQLFKNDASKQASNFLEVLLTKLDFSPQIIKLNKLNTSHNVTSQSAFLPSPAWLFVDIMYSLQKDRVRATSLHGKGIPNAYHSCTQHNTTGQARINSTDHYDRLEKHARKWGGGTKIGGCKYAHSGKHTVG